MAANWLARAKGPKVRGFRPFHVRVPRMKSHLSLNWTTFCAFAVAMLSAAACGGRYQTFGEVVDDAAGRGGSSSNAGRGGSVSSSAGSSAGGTANGVGGSNSGGTSSAGSSAAGSGGVDCRLAKCVPLTCLNGQQALTEPGQCCPSRCSGCPVCKVTPCPTGSHFETVASDCCGQCVPDANAGACAQGRQAYAKQRQAMAEKYSYGCASSSECVTVAPVNSCEQGCAYATVWYGIADSFESNLSNLAAMTCSSCMQGPIPPCAAPKPPVCINARCQ